MSLGLLYIGMKIANMIIVLRKYYRVLKVGFLVINGMSLAFLTHLFISTLSVFQQRSHVTFQKLVSPLS